MARETKISWCDASWNYGSGCQRVSPGCENCYAERFAARFGGEGEKFEGFSRMTPSGPRWTGKVAIREHLLNKPLSWKKPLRIFTNSMTDAYHKEFDFADTERAFRVMQRAYWHVFMILTKRAERMREFLNDPERAERFRANGGVWPLPNVWAGVSVENQEYAHKRIPVLLDTNSPIKFLSVEPMIGPVDLRKYIYKMPDGRPSISLVIVGCETGPRARPMDENWARRLRDQCVPFGVRFFLKQLKRRGKKVETPKLDGRRWTQIPRALPYNKRMLPREWNSGEIFTSEEQVHSTA